MTLSLKGKRHQRSAKNKHFVRRVQHKWELRIYPKQTQPTMCSDLLLKKGAVSRLWRRAPNSLYKAADSSPRLFYFYNVSLQVAWGFMK